MGSVYFNNKRLSLIALALAWVIASSCAPQLIGAEKLAALASAATSSGGSSGSSGFSTATLSGLKGFQAAEVADFDANGFLDIAMASPTTNDIVVKASTGAGAWGADVTFTPTGTPIGLAAGDLNHDGNPDLFVTIATGGVDVFTRAGGTFGAAAHYAGGTTAAGITLGDFNKNGSIDAVITDFTGNQIAIMLGNRLTNTLGAAVTFATGNGPVGITSADFNHDGSLDVVYTNSVDNTISIRFGNGAGSFGAATTYAVGTTPIGIVHGDFNRDGHQDIVVANYGSNNVSYLSANAVGVFAAAVNTVVGTGPVNLAVADLNVDGKLDVVVANYGTNNASKLLGNGAGVFGAAVNSATSNTPLAVVAGDFDRSGEPDGAVIEQADTTPTLVLGTDPAAPGTFTENSNLAMVAGSYPNKLTSGDIDNDGDDDLVVSDMALAKVRVFLNDGAGVLTFNQDLAIAGGNGARSVTLGDMDGDGDLDLVVAEYNPASRTSIYKNNGTGTFGASFDSQVYDAGGGEAWDSQLADIDNDGDLDVVAMGDTFASSPVVEIYTNDGTGNVTLSDTIVSAAGHDNGRHVALGDIDNDGDIDFVINSYDNNFMGFALNDGTGNFPAAPTWIASGAGSSPDRTHLVDFNRDGYLDLVIGSSGPALEALLMTNTGAASFNAPVTYDNPIGALAGQDILFLDFNFDGMIDYFATYYYGVAVGSTGVESITGNGGTGMAHSGYATGSCDSATYGVVTDFNRDGRPDVAVGCEVDDNVSVYFSN